MPVACGLPCLWTCWCLHIPGTLAGLKATETQEASVIESNVSLNYSTEYTWCDADDQHMV